MPTYAVVDSHCDTLSRLYHIKNWDDFDFNTFKGPINLSNLKTGSVVIQFFAVFVDQAHQHSGSLRYALQLIESFNKLLKKNSSAMTFIGYQEDVEKLKLHKNKVGCLLTIEGGEALEGSLEILPLLYQLGVRSIGLTWNHRNLLADGCHERESAGGLSSFGKKVIATMEELNMIVDLAHISEKGFWDALACTTKPFIVSHSNCKSLCDHPRNLTDRQIQAISKREGMLGINFYPPFLSTNAKKVDINRVVDHIEHACIIAGTYKHVGIGSDFDGIDQFVAELSSSAHYHRLWEALLRRGFNDSQVKAISSDNYFEFLGKALPSYMSYEGNR
ncbi:dipeptidase [Heliorestis acidaminivorans]|uniref:dipeptidase n=1 Tax=Heliorestis acidaminivorans TaxID=553427 RepID=UPI0014797BE6|nr:dipeptidase [Heliorestis acidaminivorans]